VKTTHKASNIAEIYMKEVARIHGVPKEIVSDKDPKFTSNFWKGLFKGFGNKFKSQYSVSYRVRWENKED
jgi:hypothetical protein